jgi:hypothetical protein
MKLFSYLLILSLAFSPLAANPSLAGEDDVVAVFEIKGDVPEAPDASGLGELFGEQPRCSIC